MKKFLSSYCLLFTTLFNTVSMFSMEQPLDDENPPLIQLTQTQGTPTEIRLPRGGLYLGTPKGEHKKTNLSHLSGYFSSNQIADAYARARKKSSHAQEQSTIEITYDETKPTLSRTWNFLMKILYQNHLLSHYKNKMHPMQKVYIM